MFTNHILSNLKAEKNPKDRFQTARTKLIIGFNITLILWIVPEYTKKLHSMQKCVRSYASKQAECGFNNNLALWNMYFNHYMMTAVGLFVLCGTIELFL